MRCNPNNDRTLIEMIAVSHSENQLNRFIDSWRLTDRFRLTYDQQNEGKKIH